MREGATGVLPSVNQSDWNAAGSQSTNGVKAMLGQPRAGKLVTKVGMHS